MTGVECKPYIIDTGYLYRKRKWVAEQPIGQIKEDDERRGN